MGRVVTLFHAGYVAAGKIAIIDEIEVFGKS